MRPSRCDASPPPRARILRKYAVCRIYPVQMQTHSLPRIASDSSVAKLGRKRGSGCGQLTACRENPSSSTVSSPRPRAGRGLGTACPDSSTKKHGGVFYPWQIVKLPAQCPPRGCAWIASCPGFVPLGQGGQSVQPPLPSPPPFRRFPDSGQAGEALDQAFLIKSVSLALFGVSVSLVSTLTLILTSSTLPKVFGRFLPFSPRRPSRLEFLASPCLANNTCSPARQVFRIFENASLLLASLIDSSDLKTSSYSTRPFIQPLSHSAIDRSIHYHACRAGYSFL